MLAPFDSIRTLGIIGVFLRTEYGAACKIIYLAFGTCFTSAPLRNCSLRTLHITKMD